MKAILLASWLAIWCSGVGLASDNFSDLARMRLEQGQTMRFVIELAETRQSDSHELDADHLDAMLMDQSSGRIISTVAAGRQYVAELNLNGVGSLQSDPRIATIREEQLLAPAAINLADGVGASPLHASGVDGGGLIIFVLDTGVDRDHPALDGRVIGGACFSSNTDFTESLCPGGVEEFVGETATAPCTDLDMCDHGTGIASIMVGSDADYTGVAPGAVIYPIQIFSRVNDEGLCGGESSCLRAWESDIIAAMEHIRIEFFERASDMASVYIGAALADIQRVSIGSVVISTFRSYEQFDIIPIVAPSGNTGSLGGAWYNADVWYVQALNESGARADFSTTWFGGGLTGYYLGPTLAAPGENIRAAIPGGGYGAMTGTSVAAAQLAAGAALLRQEFGLTGGFVYQRALRDTGRRVSDRVLNSSVTAVDFEAARDELRQTVLGDQFNLGRRPEGGGEFGLYFGDDRIVLGGPQGGAFEWLVGHERTARIPFRGPVITSSDIVISTDANWLSAVFHLQNTTDFVVQNVEIGITQAGNDLPPGTYEGTVTMTYLGEHVIEMPVTLLVSGGGSTTASTARMLEGVWDQDYTHAAGGDGEHWWRWVAPETGYFSVRSAHSEILGPEGVSSQLDPDVFRGSSGDLTEVSTETLCRTADSNTYLAAARVTRFRAEAGETYFFRTGSRGNGIFFEVRRSLAIDTTDPERAPLLEGSDVSRNILFGGTEGLCVDSPQGEPLQITLDDHALFRWRPNVSGRHGFWNVSGLSPRALPPGSGRVTVYAADGSTELSRYDVVQDFTDSGALEGYVDVDAGELYWVHVRARMFGGTTLRIAAPDNIVPPSNDDFEDAAVLTGRNLIVTANNRFATRQTFTADADDAGHSLWWSWTPDFTGSVLLDLDGSYFGNLNNINGASRIRVFTGTDQENLAEVATSRRVQPSLRNTNETLYMTVSVGETYYIRIDGPGIRVGGQHPAGDIRLSLRGGVSPDNDDFSDADEIAIGARVSGNNFYASHEAGEPREVGQADLMDGPEELGVWYRFVVPESGMYRVLVWADDINPQAALYTGDGVGALTVRAYDSHSGDYPSNWPFRVSFNAIAGEILYLRISTFQYQMGNFEAEVRPAGPENDDLGARIQYWGSELQPPTTYLTENLLATMQANELEFDGLNIGGSIWYSVHGRGTYAIDTSGSDIDTVVYAWNPALDPAIRALNDNFAESAGVVSSRIELEHQYFSDWAYVGVAGRDNQRGNLRINIGMAEDLVPVIRSALLPTARAGQVGQPITAFVTILNAGRATALGCRIELADMDFPAELSFQPTDPATNQLSLATGQSQAAEAFQPVTYVVSLTPSAPFDPTEVELRYLCDDVAPAPSVRGLNTFLLSAATEQPADVVAIAATVGNTGIADLSGANRVGFFATSAVNIGAADSITFSADTGDNELPVEITVCETDMAQGGACKEARGVSVTVNMTDNTPRTFAVFVRATGDVEFSPGTNRVFARWRDSDGVVRGATSVAVRTN